jgi:hypothetical protein
VRAASISLSIWLKGNAAWIIDGAPWFAESSDIWAAEALQLAIQFARIWWVERALIVAAIENDVSCRRFSPRSIATLGVLASLSFDTRTEELGRYPRSTESSPV